MPPGQPPCIPEALSVLDIGGQDTKVISLGAKGKVIDFEMNDKCAAGTGKFLEVMARALGYSLEEMAAHAIAAERTVAISSMCTVFAESEVTGLVHRGEDRSAIARGLHQSIARRTVSSLKRLGATGPLVFAGGVAKNPAMVELIREGFSGEVVVPGDERHRLADTGRLGSCDVRSGERRRRGVGAHGRVVTTGETAGCGGVRSIRRLVGLPRDCSGNTPKSNRQSKEGAMSGRSPAGPLMAEHRVIERMLAVLEDQLRVMAETGTVDPALIDTATDFIRTYADRCHHGKEEDILFRRLADKPLERELAGMMAGLVDDHVRGRAMTRSLIDANTRYRRGDTSALTEIETCVRDLVEFYPVHIAKEDRHFFKPCLEYFTDAEKQTMLSDFDEFDRALIHEKYRGIVESLEQPSG